MGIKTDGAIAEGGGGRRSPFSSPPPSSPSPPSPPPPKPPTEEEKLLACGCIALWAIVMVILGVMLGVLALIESFLEMSWGGKLLSVATVGFCIMAIKKMRSIEEEKDKSKNPKT